MTKAVPFFFDSKKQVLVELIDGMTFGRNKECDYSVVDHRVSGLHFKVMIKSNGIFIIDLESSNKTKLNGDNIDSNTEIKLKIKDKVVFGDQNFQYYFDNIEDFIIPDVTTSFRVDSNADFVDDMIGSEKLNGIDLHLGNKKKVNKLGDLKKSRAYITEIEEKLDIVNKDIQTFNSLKNSYDDLVVKIRASEQELGNSEYESQEDFVKELKSFDFSINELNHSVDEAKKNISLWSSQIEDIKSNISDVERLQNIFSKIKIDKEEEIKLSNEISNYQGKNLDDEKSRFEKIKNDEQDSYKLLQEDYADSLKYKKKRLVA
ncbi:hypothetical protein A9Q84_02020 [Halobacteriovorax marinus]|uniref:FHA domain-containing protein n=1 Tax=Halobacteriovorax marinus TaxID=97084 RepID=A0A1Y5FIZ4_9BACT|nr:hypothetical protein A9Q84_02020 [Halobacteriovorax marinus]